MGSGESDAPLPPGELLSRTSLLLALLWGAGVRMMGVI